MCMSHISKRLAQAIEAVRNLPLDQQDLLAVEMLKRAQLLSRPPTKLTAEERAELEAELAAARRGEFATDAEVAAMFSKHGL
jgi:predicted transcriptional regulator